ncbi:MAG: protein-L-isoaspartate(D-aspartate) O-methyltransferase [Chloroflexi bacterium]|nr:protein-L-isoaspartate(D-aspartate) O-methyltransferase [Chloroflexota bacterium]
MTPLFSCSNRDTQADDRVISVDSFLTPDANTGSASPPPDATPTPTYQPTEAAPTPANVDRDFEDTPSMQERREAMVGFYIRSAVSDERVIDAMLAVPRHSFVPTRLLSLAYNDHPLPIGYGQTISQPSLVAMMTELLDLQPGESVLEIGTGSGYQAAILREIVDDVYTIEIIPELAGSARRIFDEIGYEDIHTMRADGYYGWWEYAPFDAIIVTAAPDHVPAPLVAQLNPDGGRMVIPIGPPGGYQSLWVLERQGEEVFMQRVFDVAFVPLTRDEDE